MQHRGNWESWKDYPSQQQPWPPWNPNFMPPPQFHANFPPPWSYHQEPHQYSGFDQFQEAYNSQRHPYNWEGNAHQFSNSATDYFPEQHSFASDYFDEDSPHEIYRGRSIETLVNGQSTNQVTSRNEPGTSTDQNSLPQSLTELQDSVHERQNTVEAREQAPKVTQRDQNSGVLPRSSSKGGPQKGKITAKPHSNSPRDRSPRGQMPLKPSSGSGGGSQRLKVPAKPPSKVSKGLQSKKSSPPNPSGPKTKQSNTSGRSDKPTSKNDVKKSQNSSFYDTKRGNHLQRGRGALNGGSLLGRPPSLFSNLWNWKNVSRSDEEDDGNEINHWLQISKGNESLHAKERDPVSKDPLPGSEEARTNAIKEATNRLKQALKTKKSMNLNKLLSSEDESKGDNQAQSKVTPIPKNLFQLELDASDMRAIGRANTEKNNCVAEVNSDDDIIEVERPPIPVRQIIDLDISPTKDEQADLNSPQAEIGRGSGKRLSPAKVPNVESADRASADECAGVTHPESHSSEDDGLPRDTLRAAVLNVSTDNVDGKDDEKEENASQLFGGIPLPNGVSLSDENLHEISNQEFRHPLSLVEPVITSTRVDETIGSDCEMSNHELVNLRSNGNAQILSKPEESSEVNAVMSGSVPPSPSNSTSLGISSSGALRISSTQNTSPSYGKFSKNLPLSPSPNVIQRRRRASSSSSLGESSSPRSSRVFGNIQPQQSNSSQCEHGSAPLVSQHSHNSRQREIISGLQKINQSKLRDLINNPRSGKLDFAMRQLMKEHRAVLSKRSRDVAERRIPAEFLNPKSTDLPPDDSTLLADFDIDWSSLPGELICTLGDLFQDFNSDGDVSNVDLQCASSLGPNECSDFTPIESGFSEIVDNAGAKADACDTSIEKEETAVNSRAPLVQNSDNSHPVRIRVCRFARENLFSSNGSNFVDTEHNSFENSSPEPVVHKITDTAVLEAVSDIVSIDCVDVEKTNRLPPPINITNNAQLKVSVNDCRDVAASGLGRSANQTIRSMNIVEPNQVENGARDKLSSNQSGYGETRTHSNTVQKSKKGAAEGKKINRTITNKKSGEKPSYVTPKKGKNNGKKKKKGKHKNLVRLEERSWFGGSSSREKNPTPSSNSRFDLPLEHNTRNFSSSNASNLSEEHVGKLHSEVDLNLLSDNESQTLSGNSLSPTLSGNSLSQTLSGNSLSQTLSADNLSQSSSVSNLSQTLPRDNTSQTWPCESITDDISKGNIINSSSDQDVETGTSNKNTCNSIESASLMNDFCNMPSEERHNLSMLPVLMMTVPADGISDAVCTLSATEMQKRITEIDIVLQNLVQERFLLSQALKAAQTSQDGNGSISMPNDCMPELPSSAQYSAVNNEPATRSISDCDPEQATSEAKKRKSCGSDKDNRVSKKRCLEDYPVQLENSSDVLLRKLGEDGKQSELIVLDDDNDVTEESRSKVSENCPQDELIFTSIKGVQGTILDIKATRRFTFAASQNGLVYAINQSRSLTAIFGNNSPAGITCIEAVDSSSLTLFTGSGDGIFCIYEVNEFQSNKRIQAIREPKFSFNISSGIHCLEANWGFVYIGTKAGSVIPFNIATKTVGEPLSEGGHPVLCIKSSREGPRKVLIVGYRHQPIAIRDALSGLLLRSLGESDWIVYSLLLNKNLLYCGGNTDSVRVFDFQSGLLKYTLKTGCGIVDLTQTGDLLYCCCYDGKIYVYSLERKKLLFILDGPSGKMMLALQIIRKRIFCGSKDSPLAICKVPGFLKKQIKPAAIEEHDKSTKKNKSKKAKFKTGKQKKNIKK